MKSGYPFKNLVFEGGGMKGLAYLGAFEVLGQYKIDQQIARVVGTSAGAIMATVVSFRLSVPETVDMFNSLDFAKIPREIAHEDFARLPQRMQKDLDTPLGHLESIHRFSQRFGLHTLTYFHNWLQEIIASQCNGNGLATFADFKQRSFRDLYVVASNISQHTSQIFSYETTPNAAVADVVRMSMSIPLYFEALQFDGTYFGQGDWYVDGGLFNNYPITTFDHPRYANDQALFMHGVNWETLGCHLFTPDDCTGHKEPIIDLPSFARNLSDSMLNMQKIRLESERLHKLRSIDISDCCVSTRDFSMTPGSQKYNELLESGRAAARAFLADYELPSLEMVIHPLSIE